jgi:hypothetical protein
MSLSQMFFGLKAWGSSMKAFLCSQRLYFSRPNVCLQMFWPKGVEPSERLALLDWSGPYVPMSNVFWPKGMEP